MRGCNLREFSEHMFRRVDFLKGYADDLDTVMDDFRNYKSLVPTYGAIILNEDLTHV